MTALRRADERHRLEIKYLLLDALVRRPQRQERLPGGMTLMPGKPATVVEDDGTKWQLGRTGNRLVKLH